MSSPLVTEDAAALNGKTLLLTDASVSITGGLIPASDSVQVGWVLRKKVTLTDAQIKALPTTAVTLISAPAANVQIRVVSATLIAQTTAGAYTNLNATYVDLHGTNYTLYGPVKDTATDPALTTFTELLGGAAHTVYQIPVPGVVATGPMVTISTHDVFLAGANMYVQDISVLLYTDVSGVALQLFADNNGSGNFTGGNAANTLTVVLYYMLEPLV